MDSERVKAAQEKMAKKRAEIREQLEKIGTGEVFRRTNSWDNPLPHPPRPGELAMGVPSYRRSKR